MRAQVADEELRRALDVLEFEAGAHRGVEQEHDMERDLEGGEAVDLLLDLVLEEAEVRPPQAGDILVVAVVDDHRDGDERGLEPDRRIVGARRGRGLGAAGRREQRDEKERGREPRAAHLLPLGGGAQLTPESCLERLSAGRSSRDLPALPSCAVASPSVR